MGGWEAGEAEREGEREGGWVEGWKERGMMGHGMKHTVARTYCTGPPLPPLA